MKTNRKCIFCGRDYYFCNNCNDKRDPKIYTTFDSEKCMTAFQTLVDEDSQRITTDEAKDKLIELGIDEDYVTWERNKEHVKRIMSKKEVETFFEDFPQEEIETDTYETESYSLPKRTTKRKYKI